MGKKINPLLKRRFEVIDKMTELQTRECLDEFEVLGIGNGAGVRHQRNQTQLKDLTITMTAFLNALDGVVTCDLVGTEEGTIA